MSYLIDEIMKRIKLYAEYRVTFEKSYDVQEEQNAFMAAHQLKKDIKEMLVNLENDKEKK